MVADCALAVFIKGEWRPKSAAIGQRAKAGIKVIKTRVDQFHRDNQTAKHVCHGAMRLNVGAKFVAAKKHVAAKERISFALEIKVLGQPLDFVAALFHPFGKKRLLTGAFFVAEIARDKFAANGQPSVGCENHVGKSRLWRN